jgi:hypothetical protein
LNGEGGSTNHDQNNAITTPAITTTATAMALAHAG